MCQFVKKLSAPWPSKAAVQPCSTACAETQSIVWVQWGRGLPLLRVRGVPLAGEAFGFGDLGGVHLACSSVATVDSVLPVPTGHS